MNFGFNDYSGGVLEVSGGRSYFLASTRNPVAVYDLMAENVDYDVAGARLTHMYGEITQLSSHDCGPGQYLCFRVAHNGTNDLIRVSSTNSWGLDVDYAGGDCAEIVAPVRTHTGSTGRVDYLDVLDPAWMRTWAVP